MPAGSIQQINISRGGIPKRPVPEALITPLGIQGDSHAHPQIHGGLQKALLLISSEGIEELVEAGFPLYAGALGENITSKGVDRRSFRLGQRYRLGQVVIEFTKIRQPCNTLNPYGRGIQQAIYDSQVKAKDHSSPRWGLSGMYARVLNPGTIYVGDPIALLDELA